MPKLDPGALLRNLNANNKIDLNEPQLQREIITNLNDFLERISLSAVINKINNVPGNQLWTAIFVCFCLCFDCLTGLWASLSQNVCLSLMPRVTSLFRSQSEIQQEVGIRGTWQNWHCIYSQVIKKGADRCTRENRAVKHRLHGRTIDTELFLPLL